MRKVKLLLEDLQVESFEVDPGSLDAGTVHGLEVAAEPAASGVHTGCMTHCPTEGCENCNSVVRTHCWVECPSYAGTCFEFTCNPGDWTCGWDCTPTSTCQA